MGWRHDPPPMENRCANHAALVDLREVARSGLMPPTAMRTAAFHGFAPTPPHPVTLISLPPPRQNPAWTRSCASGCTWSTARATAPSPGRPTPRVVKQGKSSGGSVDTTKTRSGPQRVRMSSGERPIGTAKGKRTNTRASCQTPYPPPPSVVRSPPSPRHLLRGQVV